MTERGGERQKENDKKVRQRERGREGRERKKII